LIWAREHRQITNNLGSRQILPPFRLLLSPGPTVDRHATRPPRATFKQRTNLTMNINRTRQAKSVSTMVAATMVVSFALTPKADAVLATHVHILKNAAETRFHLAEIDVFADGAQLGYRRI
jgi:hypothetical protein